MPSSGESANYRFLRCLHRVSATWARIDGELKGAAAKFACDSPLEEGVWSEPVSEVGFFGGELR
jgi:hypothetical protein